MLSIFGLHKLLLLRELYFLCIISSIDMYNRIFCIKSEWLKSKDLKLNLGCGINHREGMINIDLNPKSDLRLDLTKKLPFKNNSVSYIYSEHLFEHIEYLHLTAYRVLKDWLRVLNNEGSVKIVIPDMGRAFKKYAQGDVKYFSDIVDINSKVPKNIPATLIDYINYGAYQMGEHKYCYDFEKMKIFLETVGFKKVERQNYKEGEDSLCRIDASMYIVAYK